MFKKTLFYLLYSLLLVASGYLVRDRFDKKSFDNNLPVNIVKKIKPLEKYSIENLSKENIYPGKITIKDLIKEGKDYSSYLFEFEFSPDLSEKTKITTGQINLPSGQQVFQSNKTPIILMFRGYINQQNYKTGDGTRNAAAVFAKNGFITIAPDFLGYGGSDKESSDIFESRFQTYSTALSLLKTLEALKDTPDLISGNIVLTQFLTTNYLPIVLWGHSNGGQVALTLLVESGAAYPTVLWAPVSKPFPYSVLYYTDESDDHGKLIRKELSDFEENYDVEKYSLTNYLENIKAPILLQQGTADEAVPNTWSTTLANILKPKDKEVEYIKYPGADHNMRPLWDEVANKDIEFYKSYLEK